MDIVVTGRHTTVSDRFRAHIEDKLSKVPQIAPRVQRIEVMVTHEANRRQSKPCDRVEVTCHGKGQLIRAEACLEDRYASLDAALEKLLERLRRAGDRRRVHRGRHTPESVASATARVAAANGAGDLVAASGEVGADSPEGRFGESPVEVREKVHVSAPMSLEQALQEMELVGHDFYLFHDEETDRPSVVYRRRGWSYGVIHLETEQQGTASAADEPSQVSAAS